MFVRIYDKRLKDGSIASHAYLVKNNWNSFKKKTQQRIIASLGKTAQLPHSGVIEEIITSLDKFASQQGFAALAKGIVLTNLTSNKFCRRTYDWGSLILAAHLLKTLSFAKTISNCLKQDKDREISQQKLISGIAGLLAYQLQGHSTASERKTYLWYKNQVFLAGKQNFNKNDLYRTLDVLGKNKDQIEKAYYEQNKDLFNQELELVLFDTTSIYYWGEKGEAALKTKTNHRNPLDTDNPPALLQYGFSKDHRSDLKQLIVGSLMTEEGVPIAHEVFPGNQSDLISFPEIISRVKEKYQVKRIIFIADKGMVSEENLRNLEDQELEYILGVRIRKLPPALKQALILNIDQEEMTKIKDNLYAKEFKIKDFLKPGSIWPHPSKANKQITGKEVIAELTNTIYQNLDCYQTRTGDEKKDKEDIRQRILKRRYFVCFNPFMAQDSQEKRKFFKKIISNKIKYQQNKQWIVKNGYKKYLKVNNLDLELDEERLDQEQDYDGKWILITNNQTMSPALAALRYKSLRLIEQGFKDLKSFLKIRPIYHFKEERIKAHIFVSFLALILKWHICQKLDSISQTTGKGFIEKINNLKAVEVDCKHQVFVRTEINPKLQEQMKTLGMTIPQKVILDQRPVKDQWRKKAGRPRKYLNPNQQKLI